MKNRTKQPRDDRAYVFGDWTAMPIMLLAMCEEKNIKRFGIDVAMRAGSKWK